MEESGTKGVSKDVWQMVSSSIVVISGICVCAGRRSDLGLVCMCRGQFLEFVRTIDAKFEKYDVEGEAFSLGCC